MNMWNSDHLVLTFMIMIVALLVSPEARPGAVETLTRDVCFKVHGADAQAIRKFEQDRLFRVLRETKENVEQKQQLVDQKSEEYELELGKIQTIKVDIAELQNLQRYNETIRISARRITDIGLRIAELESAHDDEQDVARKQELRRQIDEHKKALAAVTSNAEGALQTRFGKDITERFGRTEISEIPAYPGSDFNWAVLLEGTYKIEQKISAALPKANAGLMAAQEDAVSVLGSYVAALNELNEAIGLLSVIEHVVSETEACRADAKRIAPRRDFAANFKLDCRSPEFDYPVCMHGTMWINFDAQGRAVGQAGLSNVCGTDTEKRQCVDVPETQITGVSGQVLGNTLSATVNYMLPSNKSKKDTGNFRFEGRVTPDGNVMPVIWRGSGTVTTTENKYPLPPSVPYVIACSGHWSTEDQPACWDE